MPSQYNADMEFHEESMSEKSFVDAPYFEMNPAQRARFNEFAERLAHANDHSIPAEYKNVVRRHNKTWKANRINADPSLLTDESLYELIQYLARTWYEEIPLAQLLAPVTTTLTKPAWRIKWYKVNDAEYPEFTAGGPSAFRNLEAFKLGVEPLSATGVGAAVRYDLAWTLLKESSGIYDPAQWHNTQAMTRFGVFWDERIALGTAGEHTSGDLGVTGLFNATGLLTQAIGAGGDNNITAAGDLDTMIYGFLGDMRTFKEPGQNILLTTSGVASEALLHDSTTTNRTEYEIIKRKYFNSGLVSKWIIDDNILNATPATGTQRAMMFRLSDHAVKRVIVYPFQKKPLANMEYSDDIAFAFLTADVISFVDTAAAQGTYAYVSSNAGVVSTNAGFIANGLFMQGETSAVNPATPPRPPGFFPYGGGY